MELCLELCSPVSPAADVLTRTRTVNVGEPGMTPTEVHYYAPSPTEQPLQAEQEPTSFEPDALHLKLGSARPSESPEESAERRGAKRHCSFPAGLQGLQTEGDRHEVGSGAAGLVFEFDATDTPRVRAGAFQARPPTPGSKSGRPGAATGTSAHPHLLDDVDEEELSSPGFSLDFESAPRGADTAEAEHVSANSSEGVPGRGGEAAAAASNTKPAAPEPAASTPTSPDGHHCATPSPHSGPRRSPSK